MAHHQTLAASSASPSTAATPNSNYKYDVFINSFGPVKKTLAGHLYHRLHSDQFRVFFDQQEWQAGDSLNSEIEGAIATASVHLAIVSPGYVESKRFLDKLLLMLKSKAPVIPVYYHVKPSDLQISTGEGEGRVYGRALRDLEKNKRYEPNIAQIWREALSCVADINGLELEACNGDEGELVDRVAQRVEEQVTKTQLLASYRIGLDEKLEDLENTVLVQQQEHDVQTAIVGILGPSGIGKTTVAMEFFKRRRTDYNRSCFLSDVREAAGRNSLPSLQIKLLKDLFDMDRNITNVGEGKIELSNYFPYSRALIVLDNVDDARQLLAFFSPQDDFLRSGSLILVTTRSEDVLITSGIKKPFIYKLRGLNKEQSQEFFCLHAFHKGFPVFGFEKVVRDFLNVCKGSPLALKVLGALVYQKDLKYWKTSLREILALPADIENILKISYYGLDDQEKEMFLDIACFLINEDKDTAISIWDASGWEGRLNLENMENNRLVEIDSENFIRMHDHLRDLGRDLADKERFDCRLWSPTDSLFHSASQKLTVRGINMVQERWGSSFKKAMKLSNSFVDMSRLQLLRAEGDCLESISNLLRHSHLHWLSWNCYPYATLPSWIPTRNLRVLQVHGDELETLWQTESEAPLELRDLNISAVRLRFPKSIGKLEHLEKIEVKAFIEPLPEEFVHLRSLKYLSLRRGMVRFTRNALEKLPHSFGNLTNLRHLDLSGCLELLMLPDSFGNLNNLQHLHLSGCSLLQMLPDSMGNLTNLQYLGLSNCSDLLMLPDSFGNLTKLQHLHLFGCSLLQKLPDSFGNLTNLQHLGLSNCSGLRTLPDSFENLKNLQHLDLSACVDLQTLRDSFGNLANLQHPEISDCYQTQMLRDSFRNLTNLQHLDLSMCFNLQMLPDSLGNLTNLQYLHLFRCSRLQTLRETFGNLTNLQHLDLLGCSSLQKLPDSLGNLTNLQRLDLSGCSGLPKLPDSLGNLTNLQRLELSGCSGVQTLPDSLGNLTNLQSLNLSVCSGLQMLPDSLENLTNLQLLDLRRCSGLKMLPDLLGNLKNLQRLDLRGCSGLKMLPDSLGNLQRLHLFRSSGLQMLRNYRFVRVSAKRLSLTSLYVQAGQPAWRLVPQGRGCQSLTSLKPEEERAGCRMGLSSVGGIINQPVRSSAEVGPTGSRVSKLNQFETKRGRRGLLEGLEARGWHSSINHSDRNLSTFRLASQRGGCSQRRRERRGRLEGLKASGWH